MLITPSLNGVENMALDEVILSSIDSMDTPMTLRLYGWDPPCLSLGYTQTVADIDRERIKTRGWEWIRRPTGGRAILHTDELTYSIIGPTEHAVLQGAVLESYQRLSAGIKGALELIGLSVEIQKTKQVQDTHTDNPICFEVPAPYEITVDNRKLIGSAQHRRRQGVLQHGTLPLRGDLGRIADTLVYDSQVEREKARKRVREKALTVEDALGHSISWEAAADAFIAGFENEFGVRLMPFDIPREWASDLEDIKNNRYLNQKWLERV